MGDNVVGANVVGLNVVGAYVIGLNVVGAYVVARAALCGNEPC